MTNPNNDYTSRGWLVATAMLAVLLIVSFIPPIEAGGISLRRASIISELIPHNDNDATSAEEQQAAPEIDVEEFEVDLKKVAEQVAQTTASASPLGEATSASWEGIFDEQPTGGEENSRRGEAMLPLEEMLAADFSDILPADSLIIPIEEFCVDDFDSPMSRLYEKLLVGGDVVRVAFMGDSFVEGDILTADLRELLQDSFGGGGVGYVPVASPFTGFRQTIKTTAKGWTPYNIMQRKSVPQPYVDDFFVSGWVAKATSGASTRWEMSSKRRHLENCSRARLLFISREDTRIVVNLNDEVEREFEFEASDIVRQIVIEEEQIRSLEMRVESGAAGFTAIGADFDARDGVAVDNLSIRSNNGQAMFWSNASVNAQIHSMRPYDLVVLQYGLNIMQADRHNYSLYGEQVKKMISYAESCFPGAAIIVMGVSDRSQRNEQGFAPMSSAEDLARDQRTAAEQSGVAFWNTYRAMQRLGGMTEFVAQGWAGKDYTHINYAGGREIARMLYYAMLQGAQRYSRMMRARMEQSKPILNEPLQLVRTIEPVMMHDSIIKLPN